ncbi:ATP-binding domain-containing protein [Agrococcus sp. Ld7]|uniref:ATP-binding domain-containing protein n=1 Tax=Agrococcus sp. Ld7 TaxID=649148 RepID=UPI0038651CF9
MHRYKGLESPMVIVTDIDGASPDGEDLLYVGMTRATERLIVLTSLEELHQQM